MKFASALFTSDPEMRTFVLKAARIQRCLQIEGVIVLIPSLLSLHIFPVFLLLRVILLQHLQYIERLDVLTPQFDM